MVLRRDKITTYVPTLKTLAIKEDGIYFSQMNTVSSLYICMHYHAVVSGLYPSS